MTAVPGRRSGRFARTALAALTALLVMSVAGAAIAPRASAQSAPDDTEETLEQIATCLRSRDRLLLVLLVDESGSLRTTDPGNERVTAAKIAVRSFAALTSSRTQGDPPRIDLLVTGFSSGFETLRSWTRLDQGSVDELEGAIDGFGARNRGIDTDFPTALLGTQRALAEKSVEVSEGGGAAPCKAILLFTDGEYDVEARDDASRRAAGTEKEYAPGVSLLDPGNEAVVEAAGRDFLCAANGLADRLRGDGVTVVTVALAAQIEPADQEFLRALSSGTGGGGQTCGQVRGARYGTYLGASDLSELVRLFNDVAIGIGGGAAVPGETQPVVCEGDRCVRARRAFVLDEVLSRFTVLGDTDGRGLVVELDAPGARQPLVLTPGDDGSAVFSGAQLQWTWVDDETVSVDGDLPRDDDAWEGAWAVRFVDPEGEAGLADPRARVFFFGGWGPRLVDKVRVLRGDSTKLTIGIADDEGSEIDPREHEGTRVLVAASVTDPTTNETTRLEVGEIDDRGRFGASYRAPEGAETSLLVVELRLTVRTASDIVLAPHTERYDVELQAPDRFPHLAPAELRLSSVRGTGVARGTLLVTGGRDASGCVWFGGARFATFPLEADGFEVALEPVQEDACVRLAPGEERALEVRVRPRSAAEGTAQGTLTAFLRVRVGDEFQRVSVAVPFSFDLAPPINEALRLGIFFLILLPGLFLPVLALMFANQVLARFEPSASVRVARIPVAVERSFSRIMRVFATLEATDVEGAGRPVRRVGPAGREPGLELHTTDFEPLREGMSRSRTLRWQDLRFRAHAPRNPFGLPAGDVEGERPLVCGSVGQPIDREPHVPLALPGTWVFLLGSEAEGWIDGELVVFLADAPAEPQIERVLASVNDQLPVLANELAEQAVAFGGARP